MATHRYPAPDSDALDRPDVGFVAAVGVYAATILVGASVAVAIAVDGTAASIVGSVSSAVTVGLLLGAILANRRRGLPERLGRSRRSRVVLFVPPALFALATIGVLYVPSMANAAFGTGLGAILSFFGAAGLASMARTRYARAVVAGEPAVTFRWLQPNRDLHWIGGGLGCLLLATAFVFTAGQLPIRNGSVGLFFVGAWALVVGLSFRYGADATSGTSANAPPESSADTDDSSGSFRAPRRSVLGAEWVQRFEPDASVLPELHVHREGIVITRPMSRRFVPWGKISGVRLTDEELVVERDGWLDIRCDRAMIDDPEAVCEESRRMRSGEATTT